MIALIALAIMALMLLVRLGASISEYSLGKYLAKHHPQTWQELGRPGKIGAFGREQDYLTPWLRQRIYEKIDDIQLHKQCRVVRRFQKASTGAFVAGCILLLLLLYYQSKWPEPKN